MRLIRGRFFAAISIAVTGAVMAGVSVAACGSSGSSASGPSSGPEVTSPFTGEKVPGGAPELIFKIDNVGAARPQTGLNQADLVYTFPVDGGLSRFYVVFSSKFPSVIGPVRSARQEDIELNKQFGTPAFAFSGAQPELLPVIERSRIIDLYSGKVNGYFRDNSRPVPHNFYAHTQQLLAQAGGATAAHDIGLTFSGSAPAGGTPATSYSVTYPAASFTFTWSAGDGRWLVTMDGTPATDTSGARLGSPTVVVQYVKVTTSPYKELGVPPPYANTVGSGTAVVLRDGKQYQTHWSRPNANAGTTFTLGNGKKMPFARGQVWIIFAYGPGSVR